MVQFYDPTDLFGDLAETLAEQYPDVAAEDDDDDAEDDEATRGCDRAARRPDRSGRARSAWPRRPP